MQLDMGSGILTPCSAIVVVDSLVYDAASKHLTQAPGPAGCYRVPASSRRRYLCICNLVVGCGNKQVDQLEGDTDVSYRLQQAAVMTTKTIVFKVAAALIS
jgi:hypothetical protein